jgi:hypothetical protein
VRMFSSMKSIVPNVLKSLLMEEAERQKAQVAHRQGSGKGADEDKPGFLRGVKAQEGQGEGECHMLDL